MGMIDKSLERVFTQLYNGNAGLAIVELDVYLMAWPNPQSRERLDTLKEELRLMTDFWKKGVKDPELETQYQRLLQRAYVLAANIAIHRQLTSSSFLQQLYRQARQPGQSWSLESIRTEMENHVSEVALLELEPEQTRQEKSEALYKQHQQQMNTLFNYIVTAHIWTGSIGEALEEILASPTVDSNDQQLLVSAITLSLLNCFDIAKFRLLVNVYRRSHDEHVRQRALVGWVLGMDDNSRHIYPEQQQLVSELLNSKRVCAELTELQIQLIYTSNAEKDSQTVSQEIMPDLIKNSDFRVTKNGIEEKEDDALEDVLHPEASEQRMEQLEASFQRMADMQKQGSDIFYAGFSQVKRFPFFYDLSNWLTPFFMEHPDISQYTRKTSNNRYLRTILSRGPFCNSDKYSFVIAFQQVINQLPERMRETMNMGDIPTDELTIGGTDDEQQQTPAYIRRIYLMDLYRLFRLFPNRSSFYDPFADVRHVGLANWHFFCSLLLKDTPLDAYKPQIVRTLKKHHHEGEAERLLHTFPDSMHDVQYHLWCGNYDAALELEPDNQRALAGRARQRFDRGQYDEADDDYAHLLLLHPGKKSYMLNRAVCLLNMEEYEDAMKLLYQLNYENADDVNVQRVLAWALTCDNKAGQAEHIFQQIVANGQATAEDYLNYAYCQWLLGRPDDAANSFGEYFVRAGNTPESHANAYNRRWLNEHGISDIDINMMQMLAAK